MIDAPDNTTVQVEETPCFDALSEALFGADAALGDFRAPEPANSYDFFLTLIKIYNLHLGDLSPLDGQPRYAGHPSVAKVKWDLENSWINKLSETINASSPGLDPFEAISTLASNAFTPPFSDLKGPDAATDTLLLTAYVNVVGRAFTQLSNLRPGLPFPALAAFGLEVGAEAPELGYDSYPSELLALEAFAGLLATNHWLLPEALGALALHALITPQRHASLFRAASTAHLEAPVPSPVFGSDASSEISAALEEALAAHPEWRPRVVTGALWYRHLDEALNARLSAAQE